MEHTSSEKISEALKLLEEAAIQKKDELKDVISDKYTHLKNVIVETESSLVKALADAKKHAVEAAAHAKDVSVEKARAIAGDTMLPVATVCATRYATENETDRLTLDLAVATDMMKTLRLAFWNTRQVK